MWLAFLVTLFAGLTTAVGALIVISGQRLRPAWLAFTLAFAAGTMLILSFLDVLPEGIEDLEKSNGPVQARLICLVAFFLGVGLLALIDRLLPEPRAAKDDKASGSGAGGRGSTSTLMRSGIMVALVLALHSFPEGMALYFSTLTDPRVGITLGVAIALHNLPEGIAVAAPIYGATGSRWSAFWWATLAGMSQPLGGLTAALLVSTVIPPSLSGAFAGFVAGMMVYLAFSELLPGAWRNQTSPRQVVGGAFAGMGVVALGLIFSGG